MEFFRRSESGGRLPLTQHSPLEQFEINSALSRRTTPSTDAEKTGTASRKRVPVAVGALKLFGWLPLTVE